jgi:hypothetical protein
MLAVGAQTERAKTCDNTEEKAGRRWRWRRRSSPTNGQPRRSWTELAVLTSQCLDRRIPDKQTLIDEVTAWEQERNANHTKANWHFTTSNARVKLRHLYPSI